MAGRMADEVMAAPLVGLSFQCVGVDALDEIFCGAVSFVTARNEMGVAHAARWLNVEEMSVEEEAAVGRQRCDKEDVVAKGEQTIDVKMMMDVKMAMDEDEKMLIGEIMEMVNGMAARCGSGAGGAPVTRMRCEGDWMRTWEMHRKWCDEMLMGDSAEKALAVVMEMVTRMVLAAMASGIGMLSFCLMCLDHIAVDGLEDDEAAEAADDSVLVTATTEAKMEAIEEAVGRKRQ